MKSSDDRPLTVTARRALIPLILLCQNAVANLHGVEELRIVPSESPAIYDLAQIESEVADTIRRTERNLKIQVAMLEIDPLGTRTSDCGDASAAFGLGLLCEVATGIGTAAEAAVRRAQNEQTIQQLQQQHIESDPTLAPDLAADADRLLSSNFIQLRLANAIASYVSTNTGIVLSQDTAAAHRLETTLSRVEAVGSTVNSSVTIRLHGQATLISNADGAVVDTYEYAVETASTNDRRLGPRWHQSSGGIGLRRHH